MFAPTPARRAPPKRQQGVAETPPELSGSALPRHTPFLASTPSSASWDASTGSSAVSRRFDASLTPIFAPDVREAEDPELESPSFFSPPSRLFSPATAPLERRVAVPQTQAKGTPSVLERLRREDACDPAPWGQPPLAPRLPSSPRLVHGIVGSHPGTPTTGRKSLPRAKQGIPLPDSKAFNEEASPAPSPPAWRGRRAPECPPTPVRSPLYAHGGMQLDGLARFDSLQHAKVLNMGEADLFEAGRDPVAEAAGPAPAMETAREAKSHQPPPVIFSRDFVNDGTIGQGMSAIVFLCRRRTDHRPFAIKRSRRQFKGRTERELLLREVKTLRAIGPHLNLVRLGVAWQEDLFFFTQYEFCARGTLQSFTRALAAGPAGLPETTLWRLACDAVSALHHVHAAGWVHMDVKPANLLLSEEGVLKLGDFGMTTRAGDSGDGAEGDKLYMALELLNCRAVHRSADLFSLGLTFLEVGYDAKLPVEGRRWHDIRAGIFPAVLTGPPDRPGAPLRSAQWQDFVRSLLHPVPAQRPDLGTVVLAHPTMQEALALRIQGVIDDFIMRQPLPAWHEEAPGLRRFARAPSYEAHMMQL